MLVVRKTQFPISLPLSLLLLHPPSFSHTLILSFYLPLSFSISFSSLLYLTTSSLFLPYSLSIWFLLFCVFLISLIFCLLPVSSSLMSFSTFESTFFQISLVVVVLLISLIPCLSLSSLSMFPLCLIFLLSFPIFSYLPVVFASFLLVCLFVLSP
jgi:hypothetical protein